MPDPASSPASLPPELPYKRCPRCGGNIILSKFASRPGRPAFGEIGCLQCAHTTATWSEGEPEWKLRGR